MFLCKSSEPKLSKRKRFSSVIRPTEIDRVVGIAAE